MYYSIPELHEFAMRLFHEWKLDDLSRIFAAAK